MNPKNKRTLFLTSTICIILSIVAFALSHMGGASNENYILLYVIAVLLNIVLNLALNIKIASTNGAKALVSLGKWIMPIAGVVYLIPQVYSVLFPAKTMQDTYWYVFNGTFESYGDVSYVADKTDDGIEFVRVIQIANYEKGKLTFTASFFEDNSVAGFRLAE